MTDWAAIKKREADVPCGSCTACCKRDLVWLEPGDDAALYQTQQIDGRIALAHKADGSCTYLGATGCSIHSTRPAICRRFDCRVLFMSTPKAQRRIRIEQNPTMRDVYEAGKVRAGTLEVPA